MRRQSFVGTAQYVSPEILRGNAPHFASDLWAFGCIIFQMLTGSPPFRDGSEYLIFKKILNRDYEFPDNFPNDDAKDLIEKLLKFNPQERLGANDLPELRYTTIRNHNFFKGINWDEVFKNQPPDDLEIINESNDKNKISDDLEPGKKFDIN
jgi:3-phosphoinositide dependent protein kinase-1